jgi:hypothetical protein
MSHIGGFLGNDIPTNIKNFLQEVSNSGGATDIGLNWAMTEGQFPTRQDPTSLQLLYRSGTNWVPVAAMAPNGIFYSAWNKAVLNSPWQSFNTSPWTDGLQYLIDACGTVHVKYGLMTSSPVSDNTVITTLPAGFRPKNRIDLLTYFNVGGVGKIAVVSPLTDGTIIVASSSSITLPATVALMSGEFSFSTT